MSSNELRTSPRVRSVIFLIFTVMLLIWGMDAEFGCQGLRIPGPKAAARDDR